MKLPNTPEEQKLPCKQKIHPAPMPHGFVRHGCEAQKKDVTISIMGEHPASNTNATPPSITSEADWIARAIQSGRMLSSKEVANACGYRSRAAFWGWVRREQPPHVRLSARNIRFPAAAFKAWLDNRDNTKGQP
jgi:predicted DNA-binding transcriptional regulator AlpA